MVGPNVIQVRFLSRYIGRLNMHALTYCAQEMPDYRLASVLPQKSVGHGNGKCPSCYTCCTGHSRCISVQVVHVCADHKKPKKLQRHLKQIKVHPHLQHSSNSCMPKALYIDGKAAQSEELLQGCVASSGCTHFCLPLTFPFMCRQGQKRTVQSHASWYSATRSRLCDLSMICALTLASNVPCCMESGPRQRERYTSFTH